MFNYSNWYKKAWKQAQLTIDKHTHHLVEAKIDTCALEQPIVQHSVCQRLQQLSFTRIWKASVNLEGWLNGSQLTLKKSRSFSFFIFCLLVGLKNAVRLLLKKQGLYDFPPNIHVLNTVINTDFKWDGQRAFVI